MTHVPGGDTSPAVASGDVDPQAREIVTDVFSPDGERQDDGDVTPEPTAENLAVVDDPQLSPEVAATAGTHAPGGEPEVDPK
jgi:large subunit ribosomal protein L17